MSIDPHLMDDEEVLAHCGTGNWAWVCTNQRVIRYRGGKGNIMELHDLSFSEISAISMVNEGREFLLLAAAFITGVFGVVASGWGFGSGDGALLLPGIAMFGLAFYLYKLYLDSDRVYFEFRGGGILQQEGEQWRVDPTSSEDSSEVQEFVKTVRGQL